MLQGKGVDYFWSLSVDLWTVSRVEGLSLEGYFATWGEVSAIDSCVSMSYSSVNVLPIQVYLDFPVCTACEWGLPDLVQDFKMSKEIVASYTACSRRDYCASNAPHCSVQVTKAEWGGVIVIWRSLWFGLRAGSGGSLCIKGVSQRGRTTGQGCNPQPGDIKTASSS